MTGALMGSAGLLVCLLTLAGCDQSATRPSPSPSAATTASTGVPHRSPRPEPYLGEELPDEADYADEAEREITDDNYLAKLAELERANQPPSDAGATDGGSDGTDAAAAPPSTSSSPVPPPTATP